MFIHHNTKSLIYPGNTYSRILSQVLLMIYLACSFPLEIIELVHTSLHFSDIISQKDEFHSFSSHDASHTHDTLDNIDPNKSKESPDPYSPQDQGPKKTQITDQSTFLAEKTCTYMSVRPMEHAFHFSSIVLGIDSPPPDVLS